jgi:UDP-N-acetylmuramyl pentapeptide phosphotransferase/UDP-N-acetylglucosamine-1-phosphate transferase
LAILVLLVSFVAAGGLCALLIPVFRRAFLAIPNDRSSHVQATPQGGGLVVAPVALIVATVASRLATGAWPDAFGWSLVAALLILMALGARDDLASLPASVRLLIQAGAAALILACAPHDFGGPINILPSVIAVTVMLIGMVWFINLTNFMDGLDLMSVTQFAPAFITASLLLAGSAAPWQGLGILCLASAGALLGFALLNKPPARLFLGDSGSLPLGALGASAALAIAAAHGPVAALLPFLYYIADATLTLARRGLAGKKVWQAHRDHFYQQATRRGLSVRQVIARVACCNILLCALALLVAGRSPLAQAGALIVSIAAVALMMRDFARDRT